MPFKMFEESDKVGAGARLEKLMNDWKKSLPSGTRVRRTQLAANDHRVYALVDYEESPLRAAMSGGGLGGSHGEDADE